ncbi:putative small auxin-up RNA [Helianthus debilis subsp. tardiflorus]
MGIGEHFLIFNHHHHHHHHKMKEDDDDGKMKIPKGCMAVMVGHEDEEKKRFIIPVMYINHPLFMELLKDAELEYGFHNQGPINIPCHVKHFCNIQTMIHQDLQQHHHHHHIFCFKRRFNS